MAETIYVVLLNYRGASDTIACLDSLFASEGVPFRVIVCDNDSGDGSLDRIADWAEGRIDAARADHPRLSRLVGQAGRPIRYQRLDRSAAEAGSILPGTALILVDNGSNLGFAAGNNVGLRLALAQPDLSHAWLLNNDTLVEPDCMAEMRAALAARDDRAVCGSVIHFFDRPEVIQALGGNRFNDLTGVAAQSEGRFQKEDVEFCPEATARRLAYVSGCSMLLPRAFLEQVGLMDEGYFLYYEEIDWFQRAAGRYPPCIAPRAHLYHREGQAIGSAGWKRSSTAFADYHLYRSRFLFMKKHFHWRLPLCYLRAACGAAKCLFGGRVANFRAVLHAAIRPDLALRPGP